MGGMASVPTRRRRLTRAQRRRRARLRGLVALCVLVALVALAGVGIARLAGGSSAAPEASAAGSGGGDAAAKDTAASSGGSTAEPSAASSAAPVRVVSGGDVMTDRLVRSYASQNGADAVFAGIAPQLEAGDAAWVNLEGPISTVGSPTAGKDYTFEGSPAMADALAAAGVDVVTVANNHAVDYGRSALKDSVKNLEAAGVQVAGGGRDLDAAHAGGRRHHGRAASPSAFSATPTSSGPASRPRPRSGASPRP